MSEFDPIGALSRMQFNKYGNEPVLLTKDQIHKMAAFSFNDGRPFFNTPDFLYNFVSMRVDKEYPPDEIIDDIEKIIKHYVNSVNNNILLFKTGIFYLDEHSALEAELKRVKGDVSIYGFGLYTCPECKSDRVISISMQVRGGDEGTDTFNECFKCGVKWRIRG